MNSITINGADKALEAGGWCRQQFGIGGWTIDLYSMLGDNPTYRFDFTRSTDATLFALKWR
jgi:hypothetical protein